MQSGALITNEEQTANFKPITRKREFGVFAFG